MKRNGKKFERVKIKMKRNESIDKINYTLYILEKT